MFLTVFAIIKSKSACENHVIIKQDDYLYDAILNTVKKLSLIEMVHTFENDLHMNKSIGNVKKSL